MHHYAEKKPNMDIGNKSECLDICRNNITSKSADRSVLISEDNPNQRPLFLSFFSFVIFFYYGGPPMRVKT